MYDACYMPTHATCMLHSCYNHTACYRSPGLSEAIRAAPSAAEAITLAHTAEHGAQRADWDEARFDVLCAVLMCAHVHAHPQ